MHSLYEFKQNEKEKNESYFHTMPPKLRVDLESAVKLE